MPYKPNGRINFRFFSLLSCSILSTNSVHSDLRDLFQRRTTMSIEFIILLNNNHKSIYYVVSITHFFTQYSFNLCSPSLLYLFPYILLSHSISSPTFFYLCLTAFALKWTWNDKFSILFRSLFSLLWCKNFCDNT